MTPCSRQVGDGYSVGGSGAQTFGSPFFDFWSKAEKNLLMALIHLVQTRTYPRSNKLLPEEELELLASTMETMYESNGFKFFLRDAGNIREAEAVVLIGTREQTLGLNCAYCGAPTCAEKGANAPCAFNSIDVGIAVGSACTTAARLHVDTRVMYSAGSAAQRLGWPVADCRNVIAIPVAAASKNPFFDRKPKENKA